MLVYCQMATIDFSDWLFEELIKRGIKPAELARKAGLDKGIISRILNRERRPEPETLTSIARALRLPPEQIFRVAGLLPIDPKSDPLIEEGIHILRQLKGEDKEEAIRQLRLRVQVAEQRGKLNVQKGKERPATS